MNSNLFRENLLQWYYKEARLLPWRSLPHDLKDVTPYATVVSEFMLQQTQVKTVLPYFERWMRLFPGFESLAMASEEVVLKNWEGLGYYSRAKNLHRLSKEVVQMQNLPDKKDAWIKLPGVGDYTASAVASIAFNEPVAVVDGNLIRILIRLTAHDVLFETTPKAYAFVRPIATMLLNTDSPGDHNQAMMELGATICTPKNPLCERCPVQTHCQSYKYNLQGELPRLPKRIITARSVNRAWVEHEDKILLRRIPPHAKRLANVYELPIWEEVQDTPPSPLFLKCQKKRGIALERITEAIYALSKDLLKDSISLDPSFQWVPFDQINTYTLSGPHKRWIETIVH